MGRIASAHGGTLFLDEVAEIALEVQPKLLRFLQFGEIQRVGSDRVEKVDVRVVAATHRDLSALVTSGRFRQDLYFRLRVIELELPPLRERRDDIPLLVAAFLERFWKRGGTPRLAPRALELLIRHDYPGNVRELAHLVERACVLASGPEIDAALLPRELTPEDVVKSDADGRPLYTSAELERVREAAVARAEREFLIGLLAQSEGNVSQASRDSGIHRTYLQRLVGKHGLRQS
jgi:Nif-specific regulatory protein/two-component system response regulator HydG